MNKTRIFLRIFFFAAIIGGCSSYEPITIKHVTELEAGHSRQGYFYALPRNAVVVDVAILKHEHIPGPFAQYAEKLLSLEDVIQIPTKQYWIHDISFTQYTEPDPGQFYFIHADPELMGNIPFSIQVAENGLITSINAERPDIGIQQLDAGTNHTPKRSFEATFNHFMESLLHERIDTIVERVRMDTVTVERKTLRRTWVEKTSEVRAREVAEQILNIRNKRFDLLSGFAEITYSKEALQYMNEQLALSENDYLELFTGISGHSLVKYRFTYLPDKNASGEPDTLFHFCSNRGFITLADRQSQPIILTVERDNTTRQMSVFTMNPSGKRDILRGLYYRIPENARITVNSGDKTIAETQMLISQFGEITSLPPDNLRIEFYPNTGAIRKVERIQ